MTRRSHLDPGAFDLPGGPLGVLLLPRFDAGSFRLAIGVVLTRWPAVRWRRPGRSSGC